MKHAADCVECEATTIQIRCPACGLEVGVRHGKVQKHRIRAPQTTVDPAAWRDADGARQSPLGPDGWCLAIAQDGSPSATRQASSR